MLDFVNNPQCTVQRLPDIAYSLIHQREAMEQRLAFTVRNGEELATKLQHYLAGNADEGRIFQGSVSAHGNSNSNTNTSNNAEPLMFAEAGLNYGMSAELVPEFNPHLNEGLKLWVQGENVVWADFQGRSQFATLSICQRQILDRSSAN